MFILASRSPRRRMIIEQMGIAFRVESSSIAEAEITKNYIRYDAVRDVRVINKPAVMVEALAQSKAEAVFRKQADHVVLGADTIVVLDDILLEKPDNKEEALRMLRTLSGRTHLVYTGVSLISKNSAETFHDLAKVSFNPLSSYQEAAIEAYVNSGACFDKAGAYGIQDQGAALIKTIEGDFYTVMGLPFAKTRKLLFEFGFLF